MRRRTVVVLVAVLVAAGAALWAARAGDGDDTAAPRSTTTSSSTSTTLAGSAGADGVGDTYFPQLGNGGYDVEHYDLDLTWRADEGVLEGVAGIEAEATQDLSRFNLDLSGLDVRSVAVDGRAATVERVGRELVVTPAATIEDGDSFTTVVTYDGKPEPIAEGTELIALGWHTDGREAFVVSEPGGASTFFPVNDHPSDKATYTFTVVAPEDQVVAANGVLSGREELGHGLASWTYEASDLMASYLVQIVIGDYLLEDAGTVAGTVIRHAFHRSLVDVARTATARTPEMIELLADLYGPYPFEAYGVVAVDEPLGFALETQTLTIIGSDTAGAGADAEQLLLHELAHQWVGNAVSPATWKDIWLNEGFATYSEWLWIERRGGQTAGEIARALAPAGGPELDVPAGDPGSAELFSRTVYWRGGMALQALREAIGDDAFFAVLRAWVDEHHDSVASTEDLVALAERVSGQQLDALFDAWLYADSLPGFG